MKTYKKILIIAFLPIVVGCEGFLDEKPNKSITVPENIEDLQALLDNVNVFNLHPILDIIAADEYYTTPGGFASYGSSMIQRSHIREFESVFEGFTVATEWLNLYAQIYYSNICLEVSGSITPKNDHEIKALENIVGSAYFKRATAVFNLLKNYALQYDQTTSATDLAIPFPLVPDITNYSEFGSVEQGYAQVIQDLESAQQFLPDQPKYKSRPSKKAAFALLARTYLSMNDFAKAQTYSEKAMESGVNLLDFETLNPNLNYPVPLANSEVIYHSNAFQFGFGINRETRIDTSLYNSYDELDLRKKVFFVRRNNDAINFRGSFSGTFHLFGGLTDAELLLISAESKARQGNLKGAAGDVYMLLESRYEKGAISMDEILEVSDMLSFVLGERKKELVFRGLRWSDLKRFALLNPNDVDLKRVLGDEVFVFDPKPENFVFPIPEEEINLR
ncbi:RagB/SusD family nutrient uptake outer membrane protein [Belliella marina]|uniref:RagB/SusD family nutrient uptake outer membrane protein n=1 Tax=Belliella marina TaxID=1644146 RepID=A0ABW4VNZ3_9BACT